MSSFRKLMLLLLLIGIGVTAGYGLNTLSEKQASNSQLSQASVAAFPKDIYPETGNRLPAVKREDLDDTGKKLYDQGAPGPAFGPARLRLYSPNTELLMSSVNDYLRHKAGLDPQLEELAILSSAREMNAEYEWTAHEQLALKAGVPQETIDIVKYRKPLTGLGEKESTIIELGRQAVGKHEVSSETAARALKLFGTQGTINFVSLMGDYASTSILLATFDQHVSPKDKPLLPIP
jgi:4-carboxymuconolactone decarboxylase